MGRRNYKGWDNRAAPQGNAFGGGQAGSGNPRGGQQQSSKNAFNARAAPAQPRQNAFSALAEPSHGQASHSSISQRVSFPAGQRNAFSAAPSNAFGGPSPQAHFQPPPRHQSPLGRHTTTTLSSSSNALGNNAFNNSNAFSSMNSALNSPGWTGSGTQQFTNTASRSHAFSVGAPQPQSAAFGPGNGQAPRNAFAGAGPPQAAFPQPHPPQQGSSAFNSSNAFNAFTPAPQSFASPAPHTGFRSSPVSMSQAAAPNAFASHSALPQPAGRGPPVPNNFRNFQGAAQHNAFSTHQAGFGAAAGAAQAAVPVRTGFMSQAQVGGSAFGGAPPAGGMLRAAACASAEQAPLSEAEQTAWFGQKFEKGMIPEIPPPAAVC